jgi:hypothetical protein
VTSSSIVFAAAAPNGSWLIDVAHGPLGLRISELSMQHQIALRVEMEMSLHPRDAVLACEIARGSWHHRNGEWIKASREDVINAVNEATTQIVERRNYYPSEDYGDYVARKYIGPGYVLNLEKWLRS